MLKKLQLVPQRPDPQVLETLYHLVEEAKAGRITGLAYITLEHGDRYTADVVGRARRSPLLTLGITKALEDAVAEIIGH